MKDEKNKQKEAPKINLLRKHSILLRGIYTFPIIISLLAKKMRVPHNYRRNKVVYSRYSKEKNI